MSSNRMLAAGGIVLAAFGLFLYVTLGRSALLHFLPKEKITQIHGAVRRVQREDDVLWILPTFHPAAAFRNEDLKPLLEEDFRAIAPALRRIRRANAPV